MNPAGQFAVSCTRNSTIIYTNFHEQTVICYPCDGRHGRDGHGTRWFDAAGPITDASRASWDGQSGPSPERSGPATAIIVNGQPYLVDFGPGVVRRAAAAQQKGIGALNPINIRHAFVTHLHSDHTVGYPDLIFTPWVVGRKAPLEVYGPPGIKAMTDHVLAAWAEDIKIRNGPLERDLPSTAPTDIESMRTKSRQESCTRTATSP